jgi:hypothetical protein
LFSKNGIFNSEYLIPERFRMLLKLFVFSLAFLKIFSGVFGEENCVITKLLKRGNDIEAGTHDVGIIKVTSGKDDSKIDDMFEQVLKCLPQENPVLLPSSPGKFNTFQVKRNSFTIVITDSLKLVSNNNYLWNLTTNNESLITGQFHGSTIESFSR